MSPVTIPLVIGILGLIWIGNNRLVVTRYRVESQPDVAPAIDGPIAVRILQLSDLHNKRFGRGSRRLLRRIEQLDFDLVALSGDVINARPFSRGFTSVINVARAVARRVPTYYVTGNHEVNFERLEEMMELFREAGVTILRGEATTITVRGREIAVFGLDDLDFYESEERKSDGLSAATHRWERMRESRRDRGDRRARALAKYTRDLRDGVAPATIPRLLVSHRPEIIETYASAGIELVLTGHVHGGQWRIPGVGSLVGPDQGFFPRYDAGLYHRGSTTMVVSRGLGPSLIPIRLFNPPEIVVVEWVV